MFQLFRIHACNLAHRIRNIETRQILEDVIRFRAVIDGNKFTDLFVTQLADCIIPGGEVIWKSLNEEMKCEMVAFFHRLLSILETMSAFHETSMENILEDVLTFTQHSDLSNLILALIPIESERFRSIYLWCHGKLNLESPPLSMLQISLGVFGATIGATFGGLLGGHLGATMALLVTGTGVYIAQDAFQKPIFDLSPSQILDDAYNHLQIPSTATHSEVALAFLDRLKTTQGCNSKAKQDYFSMLQTYLAVIRIARGDIVFD